MIIPMFQVDAFTSRIFAGNPAAVCLLESWLDDSILKNIAIENNLSETAFLVKKSTDYEESTNASLDENGYALVYACFRS